MNKDILRIGEVVIYNNTHLMIKELNENNCLLENNIITNYENLSPIPLTYELIKSMEINFFGSRSPYNFWYKKINVKIETGNLSKDRKNKEITQRFFIIIDDKNMYINTLNQLEFFNTFIENTSLIPFP